MVYRPGSQNLADSLSRLTPRQQPPKCNNCSHRYVNHLTHHMSPREIHTEESHQPQQVIRNCSSFESASQKTPFTSYRVLLKTYLASFVYKRHRASWNSNRPTKSTTFSSNESRPRRSCSSYPLQTSSRTKLWWPGMHKDIETHIKSCHPCQVTGQPSHQRPFIQHHYQMAMGIPCSRHMWSYMKQISQ